MAAEETGNDLGRRDFLRSAALLGAGAGMSTLASGCSPDSGLPMSPAQAVVAGRKWVRIDSVDIDTGIFTSIDGYSDNSENIFASDVDLAGHAVLPTGEIVPTTVAVDRELANSLSLRSLGDGRYHVEVGGVAQPPGAPWDVHLVERTIPGTDVLSLTGYADDPATGKRMLFTITHDPYIIVIVLGIVIVLWVTAKPAYGSGCTGRGGAKSMHATLKGSSGSQPSAGARSTSGASAISAECTTDCHHDQGGGG